VQSSGVVAPDPAPASLRRAGSSGPVFLPLFPLRSILLPGGANPPGRNGCEGFGADRGKMKMSSFPMPRGSRDLKRKNWISVLLCALLVLTAGGCGSGQQEQGGQQGADQESFSAGMLTDTGGVNDESFNQTAWEGMKRLQKELGVNVKYLESKRDADYVPNLSHFAREGR